MSDYLIHYGILGQKWGKRNGPPYPLDSDQKSAAEKRRSYNLSKKEVKKNSQYMTDKELRTAINRLNMQSELDKLSPSAIEKGRKEMRQIVSDVALVTGTVAALGTISRWFAPGLIRGLLQLPG